MTMNKYAPHPMTGGWGCPSTRDVVKYTRLLASPTSPSFSFAAYRHARHAIHNTVLAHQPFDLLASQPLRRSTYDDRVVVGRWRQVDDCRCRHFDRNNR